MWAAIWASVNSDPTAALVAGLLLGVLVCQGKLFWRYVVLLIKGIRTGQFDSNGGENHTILTEVKEVLDHVKNSQTANNTSIKELLKAQASSIERISDILDRLLPEKLTKNGSGGHK